MMEFCWQRCMQKKQLLVRKRQILIRTALTFANTQLDIDYHKTTINGQKMNEYESGSYLPYSEEELLNTGLDENVYDAVLESRFSTDGDLGENPEVHLVLGAYRDENLGEDYFAEFEFDFSSRMRNL